MRVLVVGAGLTGSLVAYLLNKTSNLSITIWEKQPWVGGRTYTYKDPSSGLGLNMGAQYISRSTVHSHSEYSQLKDQLYQDLLENGVIVPHTGVIEGVSQEHKLQVLQNYIAPRGFSFIVEHFLSRSAVNVNLDHDLSEIIVNTTSPAINCSCSNINNPSTYDIVVLTMPAPDLLKLKGNLFEAAEKSKLDKLASVAYSPRYALGLFYRDTVPRTEWTSKYFTAQNNADEDGNVIIRYASWGNREVECKTCDGNSLLLHSGIEFAVKHKQAHTDAVQSKMHHALELLIPRLPPPTHSKLVLWRCARADRMPAYHNTPGCLVLSQDPLLIATGDGLCDANFESCIKAALATVQMIKKHSSQ